MTPERLKNIQSMLHNRQTDLTVCLEDVHKAHNVSAIIRNCDAVGIHRIHGVYDEPADLKKPTSMGSHNWVYSQQHRSIGDAVKHLKQQKMQILVTHLSDDAVDFRTVDYTQPTAIILGQEKTGVTQEAIDLADEKIVIPMLGIVQSLNVSVAAALVLYEAQRQRQKAGLYEIKHLSEEECQKMLFEGGYPVLHEVCQRKGLEYPLINEAGELVADKQWWAMMKQAKDQ